MGAEPDMHKVFRTTGHCIPGLDLLEGRSLLSLFVEVFPAPRPQVQEMSFGSMNTAPAGTPYRAPGGPVEFANPGGDHGGYLPFADHPHLFSPSPWDRP